MQPQGVFSWLPVKVSAHAASLRYGKPSHKMRVIFVVGPDGAAGTVAFLASILRESGAIVGVVTQTYVEIADERAEGSDQADVTSDSGRLQALLAHMKKAGCQYALIEVPAELPRYRFVGIKPAMVVVRRCGDDHTDQMTVRARLGMLNSLLNRNPRFIVYNRDDTCSRELAHLTGKEGVISYGTHQKADCRIAAVQLHPKGSAARLVVDHQTEVAVTTIIAGKQAMYNAAAAAASAYVLHVPVEAIEKGLARLSQLPGLLETLAVQRPYKIVLDAAVTPAGMAESLETLKHFAKNRLIVLLGVPLHTPAAWRPLLGEIASQYADRLVVTDGECAAADSAVQIREQVLQGVMAAGGEAKTEDVADRQAAIEKAVGIARRGDIVVIAGMTLRPYRQLGAQRLPWSDRKVLSDLLD